MPFHQLDPPRALYIMDLPIRAMRVITDPIVDLVTVILGLFVFPWLYLSMRAALNLVLVLAGRKISADDLIKWTVIEIFSMKEVALILFSCRHRKSLLYGRVLSLPCRRPRLPLPFR